MDTQALTEHLALIPASAKHRVQTPPRVRAA